MITRRKETVVPHVAAVACTGAILFFLACLLLYMPPPRDTVRHDDSLQVYFVPRPQLTLPAPMTPPQQRDSTPRAAPAAASSARSAPPPTRTPPPQRRVAAANAPAGESMAAQLYTREGRLRMPRDAQVDPLAQAGAAVPPGMADERAQAKARNVMEQVNPVQYQDTRFAKDWKSDGTLGDVAMQEMNRGMKKFNDMLNGPQTQVAKARPPPDVRFNPALAGNQAEVGSGRPAMPTRPRRSRTRRRPISREKPAAASARRWPRWSNAARVAMHPNANPCCRRCARTWAIWSVPSMP